MTRGTTLVGPQTRPSLRIRAGWADILSL